MDVQIFGVRNLGDTAGSYDHVVGYGAYSIHYEQSLSTQKQKQLLTIAHDSIKHGFMSGKPLKPDIDSFDLISRKKSYVCNLKD